jgi:hypothetical protein
VKPDQIISSTNFVQNYKTLISSIVTDFINSDYNFAIIIKAKDLTLTPDLELFKNPKEYVRFDILNYSFETAEIVENKFSFRAGFGQGANVQESEVSMKLIDIFQIITLDSQPLFQNFAEEIEEDLDRKNLFLSKNKGLFGK